MVVIIILVGGGPGGGFGGPGGGFGGPGGGFLVLVGVVACHYSYYHQNHPQDHQNHNLGRVENPTRAMSGVMI